MAKHTLSMPVTRGLLYALNSRSSVFRAVMFAQGVPQREGVCVSHCILTF